MGNAYNERLRAEALRRAREMLALAKRGATLTDIAAANGVSVQRVAQIFARNFPEQKFKRGRPRKGG